MKSKYDEDEILDDEDETLEDEVEDEEVSVDKSTNNIVWIIGLIIVILLITLGGSYFICRSLIDKYDRENGPTIIRQPGVVTQEFENTIAENPDLTKFIFDSLKNYIKTSGESLFELSDSDIDKIIAEIEKSGKLKLSEEEKKKLADELRKMVIKDNDELMKYVSEVLSELVEKEVEKQIGTGGNGTSISKSDLEKLQKALKSAITEKQIQTILSEYMKENNYVTEDEVQKIIDKALAGTKGATGLTGAKGETGPKGETGATGAKGDKGDKGEPGKDGSPGVTTSEITKLINKALSSYTTKTTVQNMINNAIKDLSSDVSVLKTELSNLKKEVKSNTDDITEIWKYLNTYTPGKGQNGNNGSNGSDGSNGSTSEITKVINKISSDYVYVTDISQESDGTSVVTFSSPYDK